MVTLLKREDKAFQLKLKFKLKNTSEFLPKPATHLPLTIFLIFSHNKTRKVHL